MLRLLTVLLYFFSLWTIFGIGGEFYCLIVDDWTACEYFAILAFCGCIALMIVESYACRQRLFRR